MATMPGSRQCIAHWFAGQRWHRCEKDSPHRGGRHQCACGSQPPDQAVFGFRFTDGRQSFQHHAARGEFQCQPASS